MLSMIARGLELLGLLIVPMALLVGLFEQHGAMYKELTILALGGAIFMVGYWLETYVGRGE